MPAGSRTTFDISIQAVTGAAKLIEVENNLQKLPEEMARVLFNWQREDMNRKYPFLRDVTQTSVSTLVWPRSRTYKQTNRAKSSRARPKRRRVRVKGGTRPIVRPILMEQLKQRITDVVRDAVKWR